MKGIFENFTAADDLLLYCEDFPFEPNQIFNVPHESILQQKMRLVKPDISQRELDLIPYQAIYCIPFEFHGHKKFKLCAFCRISFLSPKNTDSRPRNCHSCNYCPTCVVYIFAYLHIKPVFGKYDVYYPNRKCLDFDCLGLTKSCKLSQDVLIKNEDGYDNRPFVVHQDMYPKQVSKISLRVPGNFPPREAIIARLVNLKNENEGEYVPIYISLGELKIKSVQYCACCNLTIVSPIRKYRSNNCRQCVYCPTCTHYLCTLFKVSITPGLYDSNTSRYCFNFKCISPMIHNGTERPLCTKRRSSNEALCFFNVQKGVDETFIL